MMMFDGVYHVRGLGQERGGAEERSEGSYQLVVRMQLPWLLGKTREMPDKRVLLENGG